MLRDIIIKHILETPNENYDFKMDNLRDIITLKKGKKTYHEKFYGSMLELYVDSIVDNGTTYQVLVDGDPPSNFQSSYYITRPSAGYKSWMPLVKKVTLGEAFPRRENWELTLYSIDRENKSFTYELDGSITGYDGSGNSESNFVSNSKRISIDKDDFYLFDIERIIGEETPLPFTVNFEVTAMVEDTLKLTENNVKYTIYRGHQNERHSLELKKINGNSTLDKLVVYRPYLEKDE